MRPPPLNFLQRWQEFFAAITKSPFFAAQNGGGAKITPAAAGGVKNRQKPKK